MRGFATALVERGDLATGTTGRFHGLLHSGGRYAVTDPVAARECVSENAILRRTAADCIEDTGGLFVTTKWDDPAFGDEFAEGCRATGVPLEEIPVPQALRLESRLDPTISRAFTVPAASRDPWKLVCGCARPATQYGAKIRRHHRAGPHPLRDRDDGHARFEPRRARGDAGRGGGDARRGREARSRLP